MKIKPWLADLLLVGVAAIWGGTFPMVKQATELVPTFAFLAIRFDVATILLAVLFWPRMRRAGWRTWAAGAVIGVFLCGGYALQTLGMTMTSAAKTGFITGLYVVLVPIISLVWLRRSPAPAAWGGVALATAGLALLSLQGSLIPARGDLLVLGGAAAFALHVTAVARWSGAHDPTVLTVAQLATAAVLYHLISPASAPWPVAIPGFVWWAVAVTALGATAAAYWLQNTLQPYTTPTHTALLFATEPVWAALFAWLLVGEALTLRGYLGGGLIVAGMLLAEVPWPALRRRAAA